MSTLNPRMNYDDVAWEHSDEIWEDFRQKVLEDDTLRAVATFTGKRVQQRPISIKDIECGSFNVVVSVETYGEHIHIIRFPSPATCFFPEEKVRGEVAAMRYVQANTALPLPMVLDWGTQEDSPEQLGPFIIMENITDKEDATKVLGIQGLDIEIRPWLDPNIDPDILRKMYRQFAQILLELWTPSAPKIGSLVQLDEDTWEVGARPITYNENELVQLGTMPRSKLPLPDQNFDSSTAYFQHLAGLHMEHLRQQRNDAVENAEDCERKYLARALFCRLANEDRLVSALYMPSTFKLWCDDLRPANMLVNENQKIMAILDWEFTYFAPPEFAQSPPWWLLLEMPEYWKDGLDDWVEKYEERLLTFLELMREQEEDMISSKRLAESQRLSSLMQKSWESGDFWISYAARKSFAFDHIFWAKIFPRFFGKEYGGGDWREALSLLTEEQCRDMGELTERKLKEKEDRVLLWNRE